MVVWRLKLKAWWADTAREETEFEFTAPYHFIDALGESLPSFVYTRPRIDP